jgi:hypothetical protein
VLLVFFVFVVLLADEEDGQILRGNFDLLGIGALLREHWLKVTAMLLQTWQRRGCTRCWTRGSLG